MLQRYKKINTYNKKFTKSKLFNMQEKYNKKLLTMKMLKTQKWVVLKKRQVDGSFRTVSRQTQQVGGSFNGYKKKEGGKAVSPTP